MTTEQYKRITADVICRNSKEINAMVDSGMFNSIIKGYAVLAMRAAGLAENQIKAVNFNDIFDTVNAAEAREGA